MELNGKFIERCLNRAESLYKKSLRSKPTEFLQRIGPLTLFKGAKIFLIKLLDTSLRPKAPSKTNQHLLGLLKEEPDYKKAFNPFENFLVKLYQIAGRFFPFISIPLIKNRIKDTTKQAVFELDGKEFSKLQSRRNEQGVKQNINLIGEALLGEKEAQHRIKSYKELINNPSIDYISIKISTIYSQISSLGMEATLDKLDLRLSELYQESIDVEHKTGKATFINLDMEEYRDLEITVALFKRVLAKPEFSKFYAGIVLQAYIPDSFNYLKDLLDWSKQRYENSNGQIKIRIVKGANMEMEKVESSLKDWPLAPHSRKLDSDAQYKLMLYTAFQNQNTTHTRIGVASHNIFDIAFAIELANELNIKKEIDFEMLEGLGENVIPGLIEEGLNVLLYTPVIKSDQFLSAIAYLVRRFDEATANGNYLKESIDMKIGDSNWNLLKSQFENSFNHIKSVNTTPYRLQNRNKNDINTKVVDFQNSVDTDWNLPQNQLWAQEIKRKWQQPKENLSTVFPEYDLDIERSSIVVESWQGKLPWKYIMAKLEDYQHAIEKSKTGTWTTMSWDDRISTLKNVALHLEKHRGDLIGIGVTEVGKTITELDPEISEAIDFANYYAFNMEELLDTSDINYSPKGINLVLSPWNFPIAIPAGGILASLAAGNPVIIKPAKRSLACAYMLCKIMWEAGIPKDSLFFLPTNSTTLEPLLSENTPFASVILTGGTDTAKTLLNNNPYLPLYAETGGKNATIVTAFADRELAIKHIVDSAFNNTGQKCSATSLLILEEEVFEDENFKELLIDAVESRKVGSPWDFDTKIGPMANPISGALKKELENSKNQFLLKGTSDKHLLSPSIVTNVNKEDSCFKQELFGPFLSIVKAKNLQEAVEIANSVDYGLTSGLESLNRKEIEYWRENIEAGNLYINRSTTGAIVKRQPFGGLKLSSFGPSMKAGGKNYVSQFLNIDFKIEDKNILDYAKVSYKEWVYKLFYKEIDEVNIRGQANILKYLKPEKVILLITNPVEQAQIELVSLACFTLNIPFEINTSIDISEINYGTIVNGIDWKNLPLQHNIRYRSFGLENIDKDFLKAANEKAIHIYHQKALPHGRFELLNYLQEQSISHDFHRYGNLLGK